ncbi:MAG: hypothetical protein PHQ28_01400 [Mycobacterium sp.]|nr:hypothetical protein [Mycobacterium sp.]
MKAYIYASPAGAEAHVLAQCFSDFAELYRHGFLNDHSIVWANAEAPDASFWALTDRSQYVYVHRAPIPGYVRLTAGRLRWGRTFDGTLKNFEVDLNTADIAGEPDKHITMIVKHRVPGRVVKVIEDSTLNHHALENTGIYTRANQSVVDLGAYKPPTDPVVPGEFAVNHARYHGVNHMMSSLDADNAKLVRDHLGLFAFDITADQISAINEHLEVVEKFADGFAAALYDRLASAHTSSPTDRPVDQMS